MKYTYYMHDSKEGVYWDVGRVLKQMGEIEDPDSNMQHPLAYNIFRCLYQNEISIVFEFSENMKKATPLEVKIGGKEYVLTKKR